MRRMRLVVPLTWLLAASLLAPLGLLAAGSEKSTPAARSVVSQPTVLVAAAQPARRTGVRRVYYPYWYRPYWYDPFYGYDPYWYRRYPATYYEDDLGTVQVKVRPDDGAKARLYINGAMANEFKSKDRVKLKPGEYSIEIRKPGYESAARSVYVTAGKTLKLEFNLERSG